MTTPPDGGPAFPHPELVQDIIGENGHVAEHRVFHAMPGMSLRAYIATAALQGLNASLAGMNEWPDAQGRARMVCEARFQADAIIAELNKEKP